MNARTVIEAESVKDFLKRQGPRARIEYLPASSMAGFRHTSFEVRLHKPHVPHTIYLGNVDHTPNQVWLATLPSGEMFSNRYFTRKEAVMSLLYHHFNYQSIPYDVRIPE